VPLNSPPDSLTPSDSSHLTHDLLQGVLRRVSRSFYLTLRVLPAPVRSQTGLAYLFARAADTIADTDLLERGRRLEFLERFRGQFRTERINGEEIRAIQAGLLPHHTESAERLLLQRLEDCFRLYEAFSVSDQQRIRSLMGTLTNGMQMDLTVFPGDTAEKLTALQTMGDLDRYIYYVAGCVGEFWTHLMCDHLPSLAHWDRTEMAMVGVRFGKGLQLTNVLKDLPRDLRRGRCYIPEALLREHGLAPSDLLDAKRLADFRPLLFRLVRVAVDHLDQGWLYTLAIPRREVRLRLACMWPILLAGGTLHKVLTASDCLDAAVVAKVPKGEVYRIMGLTTLSGGCGYVGTAYWGHLRKKLG
jgi:farnesyl-diphosphate farnesyltransferase